MRPFNSSLEYGLRALFILNASRAVPIDLQRVISYDYLLVHSGDVDDGPVSLHPAVPHRGTELLVKRSLIQAGLNQMLSRELIRVVFSPTGFLYQSTDLTEKFINLLKSTYARALCSRAEWIVSCFGDHTDEQLASLMARNVGCWGGEFDQLTAVDLLEL
ncbi:ABC-three component system middle component 2 [Ralstonia solanacearum]